MHSDISDSGGVMVDDGGIDDSKYEDRNTHKKNKSEDEVEAGVKSDIQLLQEFARYDLRQPRKLTVSGYLICCDK